MSRIRIVKKNDEYTSEYQVGESVCRLQAPGMEASILWENQVRLFLWIKRNM